MYLLGYDIGSSSIKAALVHAGTGNIAGIAQYPEIEMPIIALQPGWAEQDPEQWWEAVCVVTRKLLAATKVPPDAIGGIGIAYQMHGLVCLDDRGNVLRPSIIWCDSRAVSIGEKAQNALGDAYCLEHYLNAPGNFTASKLRWVRENEPDIFQKIHKIMLPGDYIAYRLSGDMTTTVTGLSEGILFDFKTNAPAQKLLDYYDIPARLLPQITPVFGRQCSLSTEAAAKLGLPTGIPIGYRAGDQPNNALSLNVLRAGELAATGGTSGVVYAVTDQPVSDPKMRVNSFAHVNYSPEHPNIGVLLCINGAGIQYSWVRRQFADPGLPYTEMERMATTVPIGSDGLSILPFGNGAERMLNNRNPGAQIRNLQFNRHERAHVYRAALEGIAFSFVYGISILREMGIPIHCLRVGDDNLFQSAIFSHTIASLTNSRIEVMHTTGAVGAAMASGVAVGVYPSIEKAMQNSRVVMTYEPENESAPYQVVYEHWNKQLEIMINDK